MHMADKNTFTTRSSGVTVKLPLFIPVYRPDHSFELFSGDSYKYGLSAVMVNAFLLFRERRLKAAFEQGGTLREHIGGFGGMLCTDSGAFQQLGGRKVDIDPLEIVKFQNMIGTDIAAPLDLITPPDTDFDETKRRMIVSQYRIEEALEASGYSDLAGIQQGGGFFSLRQRHIRQLAGIGVKYYGIGSMVPFFNKNHDLVFTCAVINDARNVIGEDAPMHVYGAGDPLDIAFMFFAGADVFDSSSYAHYARRGFYMTPYGAVNKRAACEQLDFSCSCPVCAENDLTGIFDKASGEPLRKQHNLLLILETVRALGECAENKSVGSYVSSVYDKHVHNEGLFPGSMLARSWEKYLAGGESGGFCGPDRAGERTDPETKTAALSGIERGIIEILAAESAGVYKMDRSVISAMLEEELKAPKNMNFRSRINSAGSINEAGRLREYKAFRKAVRGALYQKLRQYKMSSTGTNELLAELIGCADSDVGLAANKLLESHVSTRERLDDREEFIRTVSEFIKPGSSVIDVGCGFAPLLYPDEFFGNLSCYIAVDKDAEAAETVRVFAKRRGISNLRAYTWDIDSGLQALRALTGVDRYDAALMLKLIPVVNRTGRAAGGESRTAAILGDFPASRLLATVNRESMTKRESIEKRELSVLKHFARASGLKTLSEFTIGSEVGYCFQKIDEDAPFMIE